MWLAVFKLPSILCLSVKHIHSGVFGPLHVSITVWLTTFEFTSVISYALILILHHTVALFTPIYKIALVNVSSIFLDKFSFFAMELSVLNRTFVVLPNLWKWRLSVDYLIIFKQAFHLYPTLFKLYTLTMHFAILKVAYVPGTSFEWPKRSFAVHFLIFNLP